MLTLMLLAAALAETDALRSAASQAAGRPVILDPRVDVPACPRPLRFEAAGPGALRATCEATGWSLLLPLAPAAADRAGPLLVRRGDPVRVRARGAGYEVRIDGVAASSGSAGTRVRVKLPHGGQLVADVAADGGLTLAGRP